MGPDMLPLLLAQGGHANSGSAPLPNCQSLHRVRYARSSMDHSLLWIVLSLTTQHNNTANNATGCPALPGRAPVFSAEESLGQTCPSGDAVALSYRGNLPVSRHSPCPMAFTLARCTNVPKAA